MFPGETCNYFNSILDGEKISYQNLNMSGLSMSDSILFHDFPTQKEKNTDNESDEFVPLGAKGLIIQTLCLSYFKK